MTGSHLGRRTVLGGASTLAGLGALSGCTSGTPSTPAATPRRATTTAAGQDPDVALAASVLREQRAALTRVEATVTAHPRLATVLSGVRSGHRRHIRLLAGAVPSGGSSPSVTPSPSPSPSTGPGVPADPADALAALARAEGTLAATGRRHALAARSGAFARLLGSVAAAATQQEVHLDDAARARR